MKKRIENKENELIQNEDSPDSFDNPWRQLTVVVDLPADYSSWEDMSMCYGLKQRTQNTCDQGYIFLVVFEKGSSTFTIKAEDADKSVIWKVVPYVTREIVASKTRRILARKPVIRKGG